jgi:hypothetical protein
MEQPTATTNPGGWQADQRVFHKYLRDRYAQCVVLTFGEIEDLLGTGLPEAARLEATWWTENGVGSPLSPAWIDANRTAQPNLRVGNVRFDRLGL